MEDVIKKLDKAITCLYVAVDEGVAGDIKQKWDEVKLAFTANETELEKAQKRYRETRRVYRQMQGRLTDGVGLLKEAIDCDTITGVAEWWPTWLKRVDAFLTTQTDPESGYPLDKAEKSVLNSMDKEITPQTKEG